jgi:hypothetical protein
MSRKTPSFGQLVSYMSSEKADEHFDLYQNCLARGEADIAEAFLQNSQHLKTRKNGNYLYHEIISISLEQGVDRDHAKQCLREIAMKYIEDRCPRNMAYGCLHDDHKDHLHYHLMISANEQHQSARLRLSKAQFDSVKRDLETHVLENYPQLKQRKIVTAERDEKKISHKASQQKQRTGKLERQEAVRATISEAMVHARSFEDFKAYLEAKHYIFYTRGKHYGVEVTHDTGKIAKYRFATIGAHEDFEVYLAALEQLKEAQEAPERPQEATSQRNAGSGEAGEVPSPDKPEKQNEDAGVKEKDQGEEMPLRDEALKSDFQQDMESVYARKREKAARRNIKRLQRKPPRR